jgi:hypothetical protein
MALNDLEVEAVSLAVPISVRVLSPPTNERFFVKVLGRGYPPPTDKFRWCTDRLRINPVATFLESENIRSATVVLGVRERSTTVLLNASLGSEQYQVTKSSMANSYPRFDSGEPSVFSTAPFA